MTGVTSGVGDHDARRHPVGRFRAGLLLRGDRGTAARAVRVRRPSGNGGRPCRSCLPHRGFERCGKPIGKQDQYIAAYGGIRDIRFGPGEDVVADEVAVSR